MLSPDSLTVTSIILGVVGLLVFLTSVIFPVLYQRKVNQQFRLEFSHAMMGRVSLRCALALFSIETITSGVHRLEPTLFSVNSANVVSIVALVMIIIGTILAWLTHPQGIRGL